MCLKKSRGVPSGNMDDLKKRLSRSLSGPKRCSYCNKMVYFSTAKCKECGDVTHKHCIHHANHHRNAGSKEATDAGTGGSSPWCSAPHHPEAAKNRTLSDSSCDCGEDVRQGALHHRTSVAMTGLLKIVRWLSQRRKAKELYCNPASIEKHVRGRFGLNPKLEDKEAKKKLKALLKSTQGYPRQLHGGAQKQRSASARSAASGSAQRRLCRSFAIRSSDSAEPSPRSSSVSSPFSTPRSHRGDTAEQRQCEQTVVRSGPWERPADKPPADFTQTESSGWTFGAEDKPFRLMFEARSRLAERGTKLGKRPCIGKAKTLSLESRDCNNESLCATWPPAGKAGTIIEEGSGEEEVEETAGSDSFSSDCHRGEENIREWCIPYEDLEFQEKIKNGRRGDIFKGRWYGEVLIYTIRHNSSSELGQFLEDVSQMGMIRHENIVLFMGACIEPPNLAVITSMRKGPTLYEYLHLKRNRLPFHSKLNIARQIAQSMGYLHAKGITHGKLNSKNIFLESRVKLCMMDYGMADKKLDRTDCGCISRGQLSYLSPELMRSLRIEPPRIFPAAAHTQHSDVYAFGSLVFELLAERFSMHDQHPHAIIWKVATGKRSSLENFRFISGLKSLIRKCWSQNPGNRPPFSEIVTILQQNVSHHKRHSSSVPDKLQYTGHSLRRNICT